MRHLKILRSLRPVRVLQDRFDGKYSGGNWIAYCDDMADRDDIVWNESQCDTSLAANFWRTGDGQSESWIAVGDTPNHAVEALLAKALGRAAGASV